MKQLMHSNIYDGKGVVAVCGSCLPAMQPGAYARLEAQADMVYALCLEETHVNMAITKLGAMLSTGQVTRLLMASVDRSPHCVQLHYIRHELERMMPLPVPVEDFVAVDDRLIPIQPRTIELSKTLSGLQRLLDKLQDESTILTGEGTCV